jgi:hypothetical protein
LRALSVETGAAAPLLLEALLAAPVDAPRSNRHAPLSRIKVAANPDVTWYPLGSRVEDVNLRVGHAIGRMPEWLTLRQIGKPRQAFTARWRAELAPEELDAVEAVLVEEREEVRAQFAEMVKRVAQRRSLRVA